MLNDRKKRRRVAAMVAQHQHVVAMLRRTMMVMLPAWLVYFFAIKLFVKNLNAITVPCRGLPLGAYLVVQGSVLVFAAVLVLLDPGLASRPPAASRADARSKRAARHSSAPAAEERSTTSRRCGRARCSAT